MYEYNVWYAGMIIGNLRADSLVKARNLAKKLYSSPVVVTDLNASTEENAEAKAKSAKLAA